MTKHEIEKAAREYNQSLDLISLKSFTSEDMPFVLRGAFKEGLEFANKHYLKRK